MNPLLRWLYGLTKFLLKLLIGISVVIILWSSIGRIFEPQIITDVRKYRLTLSSGYSTVDITCVVEKDLKIGDSEEKVLRYMENNGLRIYRYNNSEDDLHYCVGYIDKFMYPYIMGAEIVVSVGLKDDKVAKIVALLHAGPMP